MAVRVANLGRAGARGAGRIDDIEIVGDVGRARACNLVRLGHHIGRASLVELLDRDEANAVRGGGIARPDKAGKAVADGG